MPATFINPLVRSKRSLPSPYRGPHGLSEENDTRLTRVQMNSRHPVLRGQLYRLAHGVAILNTQKNGQTIESNFNKAMSQMITALEVAA